MPRDPAPLFDEMEGVPPGGTAFWLKAADGVRIRVATWTPAGEARGTVLILPGRTEYIEKYGGAAAEFAERGFASIVVDWRGQGLADRLLDDRRIGHVHRFGDFQLDVAAVLDAARDLNLPRPWHMLGHSMGGGIGLRAAMDGAPVETCAFSGPMWGISMSPLLKLFGWGLAFTAPAIGLGTRLPPSTTLEGYVNAQPFEGNTLTTDPDMYKLMQNHLAAHPELGIGGPSLVWLREALKECRALARRASPDLSCITFLGENESIIDTKAVRRRMDIWPRGVLDVIEGAQHEVLMETPAIRKHAYDRMAALFSSGSASTDTVQSA